MIVYLSKKRGAHDAKLSIINTGGSFEADMNIFEKLESIDKLQFSIAHIDNDGEYEILPRLNGKERKGLEYDIDDLIPVPMNHPFDRLYVRCNTEDIDDIMTDGIYPIQYDDGTEPVILLTDGVSDIDYDMVDQDDYDALVAVDVRGLRLFVDPVYISFWNIDMCKGFDKDVLNTWSASQLINKHWFRPLLCYNKHIKPDRITRIV